MTHFSANQIFDEIVASPETDWDDIREWDEDEVATRFQLPSTEAAYLFAKLQEHLRSID